MGTELKNTIPFTITPQKMKYSGVNVKLATYERRKPKSINKWKGRTC